MKFIDFAGETLNFGLVGKLFINRDGTKLCNNNGTWLVLPTISCEAVTPASDTSRHGRYSVCAKMADCTYQEYYDTVEQCQERYDGIMRALNN